MVIGTDRYPLEVSYFYFYFYFQKAERNSAIGTHHLLSSVECGNNYYEDCFRVLDRARSVSYLKVLKTVIIKLWDPSFASLLVDPLFKRRKGLRSNEQKLATVNSKFLEFDLCSLC